MGDGTLLIFFKNFVIYIIPKYCQAPFEVPFTCNFNLINLKIPNLRSNYHYSNKVSLYFRKRSTLEFNERARWFSKKSKLLQKQTGAVPFIFGIFKLQMVFYEFS